MKKLALFLILGVMPAFGQVFNGTAFQKMPGNWVQVVPLAQITVCTASGNPCPAATLFTDKTLVTQLGTNVVSADVYGNYTFYAEPGVYYVCVAGGSTSRCDFTSTGGGPPCLLGTTSVPYFNGTLTLCDSNITDDGNGNLNSVSVTAPTGNFSTLNTNGAGYTQVFQSQTAPDATFRANNMAAGQMVWYGNSGTNKWECLNKDGSSCAPGGAAFSGISSGANSNAGTFSATGNSWDFTGTTIFKLRVTAGCTTTVVGDLCYDSTSKMWHIWMNGADNFLVTALASGSYTDQNCVKLVKAGALFNLADSGGACGGSGSASPIVFGCPTITNTVTQYCGGGNISTAQTAGQIPVPRSGTVSNLQCRYGGGGLSSSQTVTLTVFKGLAGIGAITPSSTTVTCALNSTNTNGCSDGTHNFTVAAGDVLQMQSVPANSPVANTYICSVQLL